MTGFDGGSVHRRRLLATVGAAGAAGVAGCVTRSDPSDEGDDGSDDRRPPRYSIEDHPIDEPVAFAEEHRCAVCNMRPTQFLPWAAQLAHEDATGVFFDSPGCLLAYYVAPEYYDGSPGPIATVWATDFQTRELFDLGEGYLVRETELDRHDFPMGGSPIPFENREDAVAYVDGSDHLSADDVIGLEAMDDDVAAIYRGDRLPEESSSRHSPSQ